MKRASAPGYDLFKLAVTVILILILLLMLLRGCAGIPAAPSPPTETPRVAEPVASDTSQPAATETDVDSLSSETAAPSSTSTAIEPTVTPTTTATVIPAVETTETTAVPAAETPESTAAEPTATAAAIAAGAGDSSSCNTSVPSRLSVGQAAVVLQRLNMRSQPSITAPILQTNPTSTQVEIIGGPECTPVGESAYLWWQIRLPDGAEGWSAESPLNDATYLLEPVQ